MNSKTTLNTLSKDQLNQLMLKISSEVADAIAPTYGPYGANTLVQSMDSVYSTKDGWNVLQNLTYQNNGVYNSLKKLITDCAQSVLLKIGDGTTTVTLLANEVYSRIYESFLKNNDNPFNVKKLEKALENAVDLVCKAMAENSHPITDDPKAIFNIASVATNWDTEMAQFISDIYEKTNNPIIKFENSGTEKSHVEYISGYEIKGQIMLPEFYLTDRSTGKCVLENPAVLMFDHAVGNDMLQLLGGLAESFLMNNNRCLVIVAPDFVPDFTNGLKSLNMSRIRNGQSVIPLVPFKYYKNLNIDKDCADDLCYLFGTDMISKENSDMAELFNDLQEAIKDNKSASKAGVDEEYAKEAKERFNSIVSAAYQYLNDISGTCKCVTMTEKYILATEFTNANTKEIEKRKEALKYEIDLKTKECAALSMITEGIRMKRIRLGKLQLSMGVIYVGGFGDANLKAKRDALDDATKACEAAYQSGYTVGGGIAGIIAIDDIFGSEGRLSPNDTLEYDILSIFYNSYRSILHTMYNNKFLGEKSDVELDGIIDCAAEKRKGYDLVKEEISESIISPVTGEIEMLKGCMSLVSVMIGANQLVFHDINDIKDLEVMKAVEESGDISMQTNVALLKNC